MRGIVRAGQTEFSLLTQPIDALPTNYANCGNKTVCSRRETEAATAGETATIQQGSLRRAFFIRAMACHTCDYINNEILRKAKEAADALLALVKPTPDALKQDGTQQG